MNAERRDGDDGFVAGLEALAFGVLVFVVGTLVVVNAWSVIDAAFAAHAAAREAVRAVVEAPGDAHHDAARLETIALAAARQAAAAHGYAERSVSIATPTPTGDLAQRRCGLVRVRASLEVRTIGLPGIRASARRSVAATYEEVVDPFRSGLGPVEALDRTAQEGNPCGF